MLPKIGYSPDSSSVIAPMMLMPARMARESSAEDRSSGPKAARIVLGALEVTIEAAEIGIARSSH